MLTGRRELLTDNSRLRGPLNLIMGLVEAGSRRCAEKVKVLVVDGSICKAHRVFCCPSGVLNLSPISAQGQ